MNTEMRENVTDEFFSDSELVDFVRDLYGGEMAAAVRSLFASDPKAETGFGRAVRRSLTAEVESRFHGGS